MNSYIRVCQAFERAAVNYVMVGAFGFNLQAEQQGTFITTADCDLLLPPDPAVLGRAVAALRKLGFSLEAGGEPVDEHPDLMAGIVRARACIRGTQGTTRVDLPLAIAGFDFRTLWKRHRRFRVKGVLVRVGTMPDLLRSKELADRPKDRLFLATYLDALKQLLPPKRRRPPRKKK